MEPFLGRVGPLIDGGFGKDEIASVVSLTKEMKVGRDEYKKFPISFQGKAEVLTIVIHKETADSAELRFVGPPELSARIAGELRSLSH